MDNAMNISRLYLESELENVKSDQYTLSMMQYALSLLESTYAAKCEQYFEEFAFNNGETTTTTMFSFEVLSLKI